MTARKRRVWNVHQVHRKHAGPGRRRLPDKLGPKKRFMGEGRGKGMAGKNVCDRRWVVRVCVCLGVRYNHFNRGCKGVGVYV